MKTPSGRGWRVVLAATALVGGFLASRARADAPAGRFQDTGDGTVTDTRTQLVWRKAVEPDATTWSGAAKQCSGLGGAWRLPDVKELQTILDRTNHDPAVDAKVFPSTPGALFWTATGAASAQAWAVNFVNGYVYTVAVGESHAVRCVR